MSIEHIELLFYRRIKVHRSIFHKNQLNDPDAGTGISDELYGFNILFAKLDFRAAVKVRKIKANMVNTARLGSDLVQEWGDIGVMLGLCCMDFGELEAIGGIE